MVDDPLFTPIFEYLARVEKPLLMHIGEPLPAGSRSRRASPLRLLQQKTRSGTCAGVRTCRGTPIRWPRGTGWWKSIPRLRVIGAHLGSLNTVWPKSPGVSTATRNFVVDTSARLADLAFQDSPTVRQFILDYPERILFGTDLVITASQAAMTGAERGKRVRAGAPGDEHAYPLLRKR